MMVISFFRIIEYKKYCIVPDVITSALSKSLNNFNRITLILHASYDYFNDRILSQVGIFPNFSDH